MDDLLKEAFEYYDKFLNRKSFLITYGKKGSFPVSVLVKFSSANFKHLFGFQKLNDIALHNISPSSLYHDVKMGKITLKDLQKSVYYSDCQERLKNYFRILQILKTGKVIFKSDNGKFIGIEADYLMYIFDTSYFYHLFFRKSKLNNNYFPISFFPRGNIDYIIGHPCFSVINFTEII